MTRGAKALDGHPLTGINIAKHLGVSRSIVSQWAKGVKLPTHQRRRQLALPPIQIPLEWWEEYLDGGPSVQATRVDGSASMGEKAKEERAQERAQAQDAFIPARFQDNSGHTQATPASLQDEADTLFQQIQAIRASVAEKDPVLQLDSLDKIAKIMVVLGKITGHGQPLKKQILNSPEWLDLHRKLLEALKPWPDAIQAIKKALSQP